MPTSSQALILQTTNGLLPPLFGRQNKKPALPSGPEWSNTDQEILPAAKMVILGDKQTGSVIRRRDKQRVHPQRRRTGSAPHLNYKLDSRTLSQVLSVRGIHGSVALDHSSNSLRWKVNSIGPFYEQNRHRFPILRLNREPSRFRYFHADRTDDQYRWDDTSRDVNIADTDGMQLYLKQAKYSYDFKRREPFQTEQNLVRNAVTTEEMPKPSAKIQIDTVTFIPSALQNNVESAEYFKLIPAKSGSDGSTNDTVYATFELEKCSATDAGSFRLLPTNPGDCADFKLVPPSGFISDRFRLFALKNNTSHFILLESDGTKSGNYRPLFMDKEEHRVSNGYQDVQYERDIVIPREAWTYRPELYGHERFSGNVADTKSDTEKTNTGTKRTGTEENMYDYFDDITQELRRDRNALGTSDISSNEAWKSLHKYKTSDDDETLKENIQESNQKTYQFESMYKSANTTVGSPLQPSKGTNVGGSLDTFKVGDRSDTANDENRMQYNEWSVRDFDQWSRTTSKETYQEKPLSIIPHQNSESSLVHKQRREKTDEMLARSNSVLNDVKFKASYKLWKKKKISTVRMRKELPPSDPYAVCVKVEDGNMSHDQMKHSVEEEIGCKLVSLQFDPVLINSFQGESKYRWILRFANPSIGEALSLRGIHVDGVKRSVRRYDDVMREEYDAHNFYEMMKNVENKMAQKTLKKSLSKSNVTRTTEAQTATM